jgi:Rrf2 family protein
MRFSTKSRYGIRALIDLSIYGTEEYVVLASIAERNHISAQYLEQIFANLRRADLVKGVKGAQGGYKLNRKPEEITVAQMLQALDGAYWIEDEQILNEGDGRYITQSIQELIIERINEQLECALESITLKDLQTYVLEAEKFAQNMYYI